MSWVKEEALVLEETAVVGRKEVWGTKADVSPAKARRPAAAVFTMV
jgi:hypothetical protein